MSTGRTRHSISARERSAFTYCQLPIVYSRSDVPAIRVVSADDTVTEIEGDTLPPEISAEVFRRSGAIARIEVDLMPAR